MDAPVREGGGGSAPSLARGGAKAVPDLFGSAGGARSVEEGDTSVPARACAVLGGRAGTALSAGAGCAVGLLGIDGAAAGSSSDGLAADAGVTVSSLSVCSGAFGRVGMLGRTGKLGGSSASDSSSGDSDTRSGESVPDPTVACGAGIRVIRGGALGAEPLDEADIEDGPAGAFVPLAAAEASCASADSDGTGLRCEGLGGGAFLTGGEAADAISSTGGGSFAAGVFCSAGACAPVCSAVTRAGSSAVGLALSTRLTAGFALLGAGGLSFGLGDIAGFCCSLEAYRASRSLTASRGSSASGSAVPASLAAGAPDAEAEAASAAGGEVVAAFCHDRSPVLEEVVEGRGSLAGLLVLLLLLLPEPSKAAMRERMSRGAAGSSLSTDMVQRRAGVRPRF